MSLEANKALVRRLIEEDLNRGDPAVADEIVAEDFVDHTNPPGLQHGRESHKQVVALFHAAFPDVTWTIEDMLAEGDTVVTRKLFRGTHHGRLMGIPPTGKPVAIGLIDMIRVVDGQVVDHWNAVDNLGLLQQLGVIPGPGLTGD